MRPYIIAELSANHNGDNNDSWLSVEELRRMVG